MQQSGNLTRDIIFLVSGYILGFVSTFLLGLLDRIRTTNSFRRILKVELTEAIQRFVATHDTILRSLGSMTRDILVWERTRCPDLVQIIDKILSWSEGEFKLWVESSKYPRGTGQHIPTIHLPYLEENMNLISLLPREVQGDPPPKKWTHS